MVIKGTRRVVTYERVSSEDQRERETIKTQTEEIARRLQIEPGVELVRRYVDDGVSGTIPMADRPHGMRLLEDARRGLFDQVWVYKIDRLGRDDVDPLLVWREMESLGITVHSVTEGISRPFEYAIRVAMAAEERRSFLARSAAGMERAVRNGHYVGGITQFGYRVEGERHHARLVIDDRVIWGDKTAADVARDMFEWAHQGWSDRRIAKELNELGIPTAYVIIGRGVREKGTQKVWRPGRARQILTCTTYYGEYRYGKRSKRPGREVIVGPAPAIVSQELWDAVGEIRRARSRTPGGKRRRYRLRSLIKCGACGLNYTGTMSHGDVWYRCNGALVARGPLAGRCPAKGVKGEYIEPVAMKDIELILRKPGDLIRELETEIERERDQAGAVGEAERTTLETALHDIQGRIDRLLDLYLDGRFKRAELDRRMNDLEDQRSVLRERLAGLESPPAAELAPVDADLLSKLIGNLDAGLTDDQWHEIIGHLVHQITIYTTVHGDGSKDAKATIEYRFNSVVENVTGRGSSPPPS